MKDLFKTYSIGHFINQPDKKTDFEMLRFENMDEPDVDDVHKHTFYEIIYTEAGESRQTIDYKTYEVKPGSLFFISPNQVHEFEEWQPLKGGSIFFTEDFFLMGYQEKSKLFELSFLDNFYANPCINLPETEFVEVMQTIELLSKENARPSGSLAIIQSFLHILLAQVQRCIDTSNNQSGVKKYLITFKKFKAFLEQHYHENHSVGFYAEKLFITQHHLNIICKEVTGLTASNVIRNRSLLEAKRMLTFSDFTVSEIAAQLHYFDSSYFTKVFRSENQLSPIEFKKLMSEKYRTKQDNF